MIHAKLRNFLTFNQKRLTSRRSMVEVTAGQGGGSAFDNMSLEMEVGERYEEAIAMKKIFFEFKKLQIKKE